MTSPTSSERTFQLTTEELDQFERDGFVGPFKVYDPSEMEERWKSIRKALVDREYAAYPAESFGEVTNIANYDRHLDANLLSEHIAHPAVVDRVTSVIGPTALCWRTEFFPKYPGDEGTDWHQADTFANASGRPQIAWGDDRDKSAHGGTITVWTAFTDATIQTGCLQFIPGTHRTMNYDESKGMAYKPTAVNAETKDGVARGFFGYDYRELQKDPNWKPDEKLARRMVMRRGEAIMFWSTLMHASLPNTTERDYRMGFAARYVPPSVKIYPDTEWVEEYGGQIPLDNYAAVLVAGEDTVGMNKVTTVNRRGFPFARPRD
jgi:non-heme Fe2+,alpha-ketoglutarate-dependent halogenase